MKLQILRCVTARFPDSYLHSFEFYGRFGGWIFCDPWIKIYQLDGELACMVLSGSGWELRRRTLLRLRWQARDPLRRAGPSAPLGAARKRATIREPRPIGSGRERRGLNEGKVGLTGAPSRAADEMRSARPDETESREDEATMQGEREASAGRGEQPRGAERRRRRCRLARWS